MFLISLAHSELGGLLFPFQSDRLRLLAVFLSPLTFVLNKYLVLSHCTCLF